MKLHYFEFGEHIVLIMQKQPPEVFYKKDFQVCNFIKKRLQHRYFPVNIAQFLRWPVLKNICIRQLLLIMGICMAILLRKFAALSLTNQLSWVG